MISNLLTFVMASLVMQIGFLVFWLVAIHLCEFVVGLCWVFYCVFVDMFFPLTNKH